MITKDNFKEVLAILGFKQEDNKYSKTINSYTMQVDFNKEKLIYPQELTTESDTTSNFSQNENFVVFECVHKLLEIGYKAQDLVLEKTWKLGHSAKSGRADITIYKSDENNKESYVYCIIECKTMGKEFDNAKKDLFNNSDGNQLFSYAAQARSVEWLCLYASDYKNSEIITKEEIIKFKDDANILNLSLNDNSIQTFQKASGVSDFFMVWEETYNKKSYENLIFKSQAYDIGILPLYKEDLKEFEKSDGLNVKFKEILRHNNISDPQNAFNSLLALFLCKCVDEASKQDDEELDFYYNPFKDDYFSLYKRLLNLFIKGMKDFLKEEVYHTEENFVANTLQTYTGANRKKLQEILETELQKARIYSAQFFNFKQSYNKKLFEKNGKVLAEVIQLFEKYRFSYSSKYQFLGELFEQFLNEGFKEDEGRYFTPMPITRFIWNALPFEDFINLKDKKFPKIIDFACGAGHFLTEGVNAFSDYCKDKLSIDDNALSENFYGIDKDDRLARTTQVAMLLNGANKAKIRFIDGLEYDQEFYGDNQQDFDILVANPPYSVKDFKQHLSQNVLKGKEGNKPYEVLEFTSLNSAMIENVFVERLTHILKPKGLAAIILPSSILSNTDQATIKAREIILSNFNIHAICSFGSQTFGTTGTNTIILFLSRFDEPPKKTELLQDSINAIFAHTMQENFTDNEILESYLAMQEFEKQDYIGLLKQKALPNYPLFEEYKNAFENLNDTKKYKDSKSFKALDEQEQNKEIQNMLFSYILEREKVKLTFFALTYKQKTLIIKAPDDTDEQKKFLGYVISKSKNSKSGLSETEGLLSDKQNRNAQDKIAYAIKQSFKGNFHNHESFSQYISYVTTCNLLNFKTIDFNKTITLNTAQDSTNLNPFIDSKYKLVKLGEVCSINKFQHQVSAEKLKSMKVNNGNIKLLPSSKNYDWWTDENIAKGYINEGEVIALGVARYANIKKFKGKFVSANNKLISIKNEKILFDYTYYILEAYGQKLYKSGSQYPQFDTNKFECFKIPLPPLEIQKQIVKECEEVESYTKNINDLIQAYENLIKAVLFKADIITEAHNNDTQSLLQIINNQELSLDSKITMQSHHINISKNKDSNNSFDIEQLKSLLDSIPTPPKQGWDRVKLDNVCNINEKTYNPSNDINKEYIYIDIDSVEKGTGNFIINNKILGSNLPTRARRLADDDSVIISTVRPYLKGFAYIRENIKDSIFSTGFAILKGNQQIKSKFVYILFMLSNDLMQQIEEKMPKASYPSINIEDIKNLKIPLPPLQEQEKLMTIIDYIENRKQILENKLDNMQNNTQEILQKYLYQS
ncbi:restriction endonuclease subunit S [Campylobacter insulaenigrae]|uniref:restriction endonuclease subunit S n=2 Tax=Campylobacter insulaenigrae TaxID=260714 RepID=UPI002152C6AE|nr:restriction endonuclease subunit S [Campylobacter insulaenigrae]MCR6587345.1 restriction endonuclease subunit S [Campylobacter insulaenigrae]